MVDITLFEEPEACEPGLMIEQQVCITELLSRRKLVSYITSSDRQRIWATLEADDEDGVLDVLSLFPLIEYMDFDIYPLAEVVEPSRRKLPLPMVLN